MRLNHDQETDKSTSFFSKLAGFGAAVRQSGGGDKNITKGFGGGRVSRAFTAAGVRHPMTRRSPGDRVHASRSPPFREPARQSPPVPSIQECVGLCGAGSRNGGERLPC